MIALWMSVASAAEVQRYAVVVGANEGIGSDETLVFAERDAERVSEVLESVGDVPSENIVRLFDVDARRVRGAFEDLSEKVRRKQGDGESLLFVFYSGHGDANGLHLSGSEMPFSELTSLLGQVPVDVRVLVVDACQSGELTRLKGASPAEPFEINPQDHLDTEGMAIITSSSVGEDAQESDRLQGGIFTHHFVAGLMGAADSSGDHRITLTEAYDYGYAETVKATSKARFVQRPSFGFRLSGRSDLVLTRVEDPGRNAVLALSGPGQWLVFESGGSGDLVTEVAVAEGALLSVNPGGYVVRYRSDRAIRETELDIPKGQTRELVANAMPVVPPGQTVRKGMESKGAAVAVSIGGGVIGPTTPGLGTGPMAHVGLLFDFEPMSLAARLVGSRHRASNGQLRLDQGRIGVDLAGIKKLDFGPTAFGLGVRAGVDGSRQWFDTTGDAPVRQGVSGRVGPVLSFDLPLGRTLLVVSASTDVHLYEALSAVPEEAALQTQVVPTISLELAHYVR